MEHIENTIIASSQSQQTQQEYHATKKRRTYSESSSDSVCGDKNSERKLEDAFHAFLHETLLKLVESEQMMSENMEKIIDLFKSESIGEQARMELIRVCSIEYDEVDKKSSRLGGYGWTSAMISEHMKRFLQKKIDDAIEIIQSFVS